MDNNYQGGGSGHNAVRLPEGLVEPEIVRRLEDLRRLRNELVHGRSSQAESELTPALIADVRRLADTLLERANDLAQRREPSGPGTSNR